MGEKEGDVVAPHPGLLVREKLIPAALGPEKCDVRSVVGNRCHDETAQEKHE
jgi:hypothetical protein